MHVRRHRGWELPESAATPEALHLGRREFLARLGFAAAGISIASGWLSGALAAATEPSAPPAPSGSSTAGASAYPARRNPKFVLDRPLSDEKVAATHNNFYEFT